MRKVERDLCMAAVQESHNLGILQNTTIVYSHLNVV